MIQFIKRETGIIIYVLIQCFTIVYGANAAIFVMPALAIAAFLLTKKMLFPFIALILLLPLSDSTFAFAKVALNIRPMLMLTITLLVILNQAIHPKTDWSVRGFIPYFLVLFLYLLAVSNTTNIFKALSYMLVIIVTPVVIKHMIEYEKQNFLQSLVLIYTLVYIFSFITIGTNTSYQGYGRFSGIFANPNALGIFSFLFFMLTQIIFKYQPQLFTKKERYVVTILILAGLLFSRSRSGMFAIAIFWLSTFAYEKWRLKGLITVVLALFLLNTVVPYKQIIAGVGLSGFLRLESLEKGAGRNVAFAAAWNQIKEKPIEGYGIGYAETYYKENQKKLNLKGHVGGIHNSFLWVWLELGLFGLLSFVYGWFSWFRKTFQYTDIILPVGIAVVFSVNIEPWLMGSLNHVLIQLIIILSLLSSPSFFSTENQSDT